MRFLRSRVLSTALRSADTQGKKAGMIQKTLEAALEGGGTAERYIDAAPSHHDYSAACRECLRRRAKIPACDISARRCGAEQLRLPLP